MKYVIIDTDFFRFITKDLKEDKLLINAMNELGYMPVLHEFVYKHELHEDPFIKNLIDRKLLMVLNYSLFKNDKRFISEYERLFKMAFYEMNGTKFDDNKKFTDYHHEKQNLGEIHSVVLARLQNMDIFMSNDKGAKFFVENKLNTAKNKISVVDIEETFTKLITPSSNSIKWKDVRSIISIWKNSNPTDEKKYKHIRQCWVKDVTEDKE